VVPFPTPATSHVACGNAKLIRNSPRTGLHGAWEFTVEFAGPGDTGPGDTSGEKPDIFTAIKEALDLKLESGTGPLDVLVIDSVSHPTSN
jgi:uncharacterized protein (TIGR03435 family)